jgi:hypothetical protein
MTIVIVKTLTRRKSRYMYTSHRGARSIPRAVERVLLSAVAEADHVSNHVSTTRSGLSVETANGGRAIAEVGDVPDRHRHLSS